MKIILYSFFIVLIASCKHKTAEKPVAKPVYEPILINHLLVPEKEVYDFLNFIINKSEYKAYKLIAENELNKWTSNNNDSYFLKQIDTLFNKKDIDFIMAQLKTASGFRLKKEYYPDKITIPFDTLIKFLNLRNRNDRDSDPFKESLRHRYGSSFLDSYSLPFFTLDYQTAIIRVSILLRGGTYIYHKIKNKWVKIKTLDEWIE